MRDLRISGKRSTEHLSHFCQSSSDYGIYATRLSMVLTGGWAGFDPVDRQQRFEFFWSGIVHQLFKDALEASEGIRSVAADLLDEGVDDRLRRITEFFLVI